MKIYVDTINGGSVPCLENAVVAMAEIENQSAVNSGFQLYEQGMGDFSKIFPTDVGRLLTVQVDNDPKHTAKATKEFFMAKRWNVLQWPSQSPDLNPIEHAFHLLKTKLKGKCPKNKQELKTVAVEAWHSITRDETQRLVMSMGSRLQAVIDCKGFATKY